MLEVTFNWHGHLYGNDVSTLRQSYEIAYAALMTQYENAYDEIERYDTRRDRRCLEPFETDELLETGEVLVSYRQTLVHRAEAFQSHVKEFNKAYTLTMYHLWERSARVWTRDKTGNFTRLVAKVQNIGLFVDPDLINLYVAANTLKHNQGVWGYSLAKLMPDVVPYQIAEQWAMENPYDMIEIEKCHIELFFDIVMRSGPNIRSDQWWSQDDLDYEPY